MSDLHRITTVVHDGTGLDLGVSVEYAECRDCAFRVLIWERSAVWLGAFVDAPLPALARHWHDGWPGSTRDTLTRGA